MPPPATGTLLHACGALNAQRRVHGLPGVQGITRAAIARGHCGALRTSTRRLAADSGWPVSSGRVLPHGHTVMYPAATGFVAVTLSTTARASDGTAPPASRFPRVSDGTLVAPLDSLDRHHLDALSLYRRARAKVLELRRSASQLHGGFWVFHAGGPVQPVGFVPAVAGTLAFVARRQAWERPIATGLAAALELHARLGPAAVQARSTALAGWFADELHTRLRDRTVAHAFVDPNTAHARSVRLTNFHGLNDPMQPLAELDKPARHQVLQVAAEEIIKAAHRNTVVTAAQ